MESRLPAVVWPKVRLSAVAEIHTGVAKGSKKPVDPVELPYLRVANVQAGALDLTKIKKIQVDRSDVERYSLHPGDVLMTEGGDFDKLGRGAIWTGEIEPCLHQNHVFAVRCDQSKVLPEWVSWVSSSHYGRRYFLLCSKQSTNLASINSSQLKAFPLPLPSIGQQGVMATAVHALERQATVLSQLVDAKRTLKRGLMQQLLTGEKRFPEFKERPWVKSTIGALFAEVQRPVPWDEDETFTLVSVRRRSGGLFLRERKKGAEIKVKSLYVIREGDILISTRQIVHGAIARVPLQFDGAHVSGEYMTLVPREGAAISTKYFDHLSRLPRMYHASFLASYGVDIEKLTFNPEWYLDVAIDLPESVEEQERIASVLEMCDRELDLLTALRGQIDTYKRALLSRLLSGDLSVSSR